MFWNWGACLGSSSTTHFIAMFLLTVDFGVSACAQKISDFDMLNNGKVKNESTSAQQKC